VFGRIAESTARRNESTVVIDRLPDAGPASVGTATFRSYLRSGNEDRPVKKTVMLPGMWGAIDSETIDEAQMSYGVVTHRPGYKRVVFSGSASREGDIGEQTREILEHKRKAIADLGGSMDDVTVLRLYVREEVLSEETQTRIHEVRADFFERPHYPAATMIGVADLLGESALVEIEIEAEIPDDGWETEIIDDE
jgi:enamine deaminase RidA (YjgF/YER057c/UK114 family)